MKHDDLIRRLCEASKGSAELSREVREALGGNWSANEPCITTDLSAAWEEAERSGYRIDIQTTALDPTEYSVFLYQAGKNGAVSATGACLSCVICAALLAAEGEM